jgi:hypothetical protein
MLLKSGEQNKMKAYLCFIGTHIKTIDTFEPEYDFYNYCQTVFSREKAEKFFKDFVDNFEEEVGGIERLTDGKMVRIYVGDPIPKRLKHQDEYGNEYEVQTFENYPFEFVAYSEVDVPTIQFISKQEEKKYDME